MKSENKLYGNVIVSNRMSKIDILEIVCHLDKY